MTANIPSAQGCVTRHLIDRRAEASPDHVIIKFEDGSHWTCAQLKSLVQSHAAGLQQLGVKQGELVLTWLPNGPKAVLMLLALNYLGAVNVPINIAYKGGVLAHVVNQSRASLMIADGQLIERLGGLDLPCLAQIVVLGDERPALDTLSLLSADCLLGEARALKPLQTPIQAWDTKVVLFTSGTTGPSKGVLSSYVHIQQTALNFRHVGPGDCNLVVLPMFHVGGVIGIYWALLHEGGQAALVESFKTDRFWPTVKNMGVTTAGLLGAMVQFLMKRPAESDEKAHPLKTVVIAPMNDEALAFGERFGVDVYTEFNMTELSVPLYEGPNPKSRGTCGVPRSGVELRLVDEHDVEVPAGEIGELILRCDMPWAVSHGYLNDAEATARTWRNGWFHTGDLFYRDDGDHYFFVDRAKDAIRRRGENISSFEVEAEILAHPKVREAAVVAVAGDGGEDEVLAVLSPIAGESIEYEDVLEFLRSRLAYFMLPRYLRVLQDLPKTPTQKVEKHRLRSQGVTSDTWDREAAGIVVKRDKLEKRG